MGHRCTRMRRLGGFVFSGARVGRAKPGISGRRRAFAGTGGPRRGGGGLGRVWARDGRSLRASGPSVLPAVLRAACTGSARRGGECALATQEWGWWGGFLASEVLRAPRPGGQWVSCARKEGAQSRSPRSPLVRRMSDVPLRLSVRRGVYCSRWAELRKKRGSCVGMKAACGNEHKKEASRSAAGLG